jgi:hypothetical protein
MSVIWGWSTAYSSTVKSRIVLYRFESDKRQEDSCTCQWYGFGSDKRQEDSFNSRAECLGTSLQPAWKCYVIAGLVNSHIEWFLARTRQDSREDREWAWLEAWDSARLDSNRLDSTGDYTQTRARLNKRLKRRLQRTLDRRLERRADR